MDQNQIPTQTPNAVPPQTPVPNPATPAPETKRSFGPLLGIIVIIVILVVGAFYIWGGSIVEQDESAVMPEQTTASQTETPTDEIDAIEADLNSANTEIDLSGLDTIE